MKNAIMLSIRPEWVAKILNGEKTIEIRKTAPKCDLPIDVYIYCCDSITSHLYRDFIDPPYCTKIWNIKHEKGRHIRVIGPGPVFNGKVVAKFTLNEISEYQIKDANTWSDTSFGETVKTLMGLSLKELQAYADGKPFFGWHISDLEIFDEPKELSEFEYTNPSGTRYVGKRSLNGLPSKKHPPQSWCYVEKGK